MKPVEGVNMDPAPVSVAEATAEVAELILEVASL